MELHTAEMTPVGVADITSESNKSIPRLKIAILVVGTRGDVQPFLAVAKRLQVFANFLLCTYPRGVIPLGESASNKI